MIVILLLAVVVAELAWIAFLLRKPAVAPPLPHPPRAGAEGVRILRRVGESWLLHSLRPEGHPDLAAIERGEHPDLKVERG